MTDIANWSLTPYLVVDDAAAAIEFYKHAFGAHELTRHATPDGKIMHAALDLHGAALFLSDDVAGSGHHPRKLGASPVTLHLAVPEVDTVFRRALAAGATSTMPLQDMFWGDRYGKITDPFGHCWSLSTPMRQVSAEEMQRAVRQAADQWHRPGAAPGAGGMT